MPEPLKTPLNALHRSLGGRMVDFAGYELPVQYPAGILKEHLHTRGAAGLFDVSHMGQIASARARARSPTPRPRSNGWCRWTSLGLAPGRQRYAFFTDENGGILDDLMVANRGDHLLLVVNAACKADDLAHLEAALGRDLHGRDARPRAPRAAGPEGRRPCSPSCIPRRRRRCASWTCARSTSAASRPSCRAPATPARTASRSRSGPQDAADLAERAARRSPASPVGLGARDSLRLEAGLCL